MRKMIFTSIVMASLAISSISFADGKEKKNPFRYGFGMDAGIPSGVSVGFILHPKIDWASAQASITHNALAFGGRLSAKLDPIAYDPRIAAGLFLDLQLGFNGQGNIPGQSDLPSVGYTYFNTYAGVRLGKPNGFNWIIEAGSTYMNIGTSNFQSFASKHSKDLTVSNPTISGWVFPTFITGFSVVWS